MDASDCSKMHKTKTKAGKEKKQRKKWQWWRVFFTWNRAQNFYGEFSNISGTVIFITYGFHPFNKQLLHQDSRWLHHWRFPVNIANFFFTASKRNLSLTNVMKYIEKSLDLSFTYKSSFTVLQVPENCQENIVLNIRTKLCNHALGNFYDIFSTFFSSYFRGWKLFNSLNAKVAIIANQLTGFYIMATLAFNELIRLKVH